MRFNLATVLVTNTIKFINIIAFKTFLLSNFYFNTSKLIYLVRYYVAPKGNFGDDLNPILLKLILTKPFIINYGNKSTPNYLIMIGSIIHGDLSKSIILGGGYLQGYKLIW